MCLLNEIQIIPSCCWIFKSVSTVLDSQIKVRQVFLNCSSTTAYFSSSSSLKAGRNSLKWNDAFKRHRKNWKCQNFLLKRCDRKKFWVLTFCFLIGFSSKNNPLWSFMYLWWLGWMTEMAFNLNKNKFKEALNYLSKIVLTFQHIRFFLELLKQRKGPSASIIVYKPQLSSQVEDRT